MRGKPLIDLTGKKCGFLEVLYRGTNDKWGKPQWVCRCVCGSIHKVDGSNLRSGGTKSCGCRKPGNALRMYEASYNQFIHNVKHKHSVELTYEDFVEFTKTTCCVYCDEEIKWVDYGISRQGQRYNLDRKDNSLGYSKDNCVVCCKDCNYIKSNRFTYEQMLQIGELIKSWRTQRTATVRAEFPIPVSHPVLG